MKSPEEIAEERICEARASSATGLDLSGLGLRRLPEGILQLRNLRELRVGSNELSELPEWIGQLAELRRLDLHENQFSVLPESIGQLTRLEYLRLVNSGLRALPDWIAKLTNLKSLYIPYNQLTILPPTIGQLSKLLILSVVKNELTMLPESIGSLTNLVSLFVSNNRLTELPECIGKLRRLRRLEAYGNQLRTLPESLRHFKGLDYLVLHGNEELDIPAEVLGIDPRKEFVPEEKWVKPESILDYYFRTRGGARPLNEAKLIIVGRGTVGKTSLVRQLVEGKFDLQENKTEGIGITPWKVKAGGSDGAEVRVNIWDFGGQEIMHATHQFFLTERSLYLLVLNGREGGEDYDVEYWLKLISSFGGESPVIVVLNKIRQHPFDLNYRALQGKYPQIRGFVKTDCDPGTRGDLESQGSAGASPHRTSGPEGINELAEAIRREIGELKDVHAKFPTSWFAIKDALAGMKENFMSLDRYRELCRKHNENDAKAQDDLAGYLHCLGIALNYRDDPRLRDTSILNPHWVTTGIYKLLNAEKLARNRGVLRLGELGALLPAQDYPEEKHEYLLELMRKFKLCFAFPNDEAEHRYLVPELLGKEEPDLKGEFEPEKCLNFEYHYTILPEGLVASFIVRTHSLSEGQARWRSGVLLQWEGSRALVKADGAEKKVVIRVTGPSAARRRRLLAVIRSDFERIHDEIRNLEVTAKVPLPGAPEVVRDYEELVAFESEGLNELPVILNGKMMKVSVEELLNGVDLDEARWRRPGTESMVELPRRKKLFCSYSHKDEGLRDGLETHLKLLQREGAISMWHDRKIAGGEEWAAAIDANLEGADIVLLLVSADFIVSEYCYEKEMKRAMERHERGEARVVPVILRACDWHSAPFGKLQGLPKDGKPVTSWANRDEAWNDVARGIRKVAGK